MVLVKAHALDVVPRRRLVTQVALVDLGTRLARHLHRDHVEVPHVVAGRRLVTLGAVRRARRRVPKLRDRALRRRVALRAVLSEQLEVPVLVGVASGTVQRRFERSDVRVGSGRMSARAQERKSALRAIALLRSRAFHAVFISKLPQADLGQSGVVHRRRRSFASLVLRVTFSTATHAAVKRSWLALEEGLVVGVADGAIRRLDALYRGVAGGAIVLQERVRGGKSPQAGPVF